ncbi:FecR family protein [Roseateles sp. BYS180W]|uniref:FecR family protein n=1 Tax=Roseateles rivi TaxID=3299028 RepID=A0ABW7FTJ7_9BURK
MSAPGLDPAVLDAAVHWFVQLQAAKPAERATLMPHWQAWLGAHEAHARAWTEVEALWGRFDALPQGPGAGAAAQQALQHSRRRALRRAGSAALGLLAVASPVLWLAQQRPELHTAHGQTAHWTLADGAGVWLNSGSEVRLHAQAPQTHLRLEDGELFVESGAQPLRLSVGALQLHSQGAHLALQRRDAAPWLHVFEGAVRVAGPEHAPYWVRAHQARALQDDGQGRHAAAQVQRESWRRGLLVAQSLRLDEFLQELGQHHRVWLSCEPAVAARRLFGSYELAQLDHSLQAAAQALGLRLRRPLPGWVQVLAA